MKYKLKLTDGVGVRLQHAHGAREEVGLCPHGPATAGRDDAASGGSRRGEVPQRCHRGGQQRRSCFVFVLDWIVFEEE